MRRIYAVTLTSGSWTYAWPPAAIGGVYTDLELAIKLVSEVAATYFHWLDLAVISEDTGVRVTVVYEYSRPVWIVSRQVKVRCSYIEHSSRTESVMVDGLEYSRSVPHETIRQRDELHMFAARIKANGFLVGADDDTTLDKDFIEVQLNEVDRVLASKYDTRQEIP